MVMVFACLKGEKSTAVSFGSLPVARATVMAVRRVASGRSPEAVMMTALGGGGEKEGCWESAPMSAYKRGSGKRTGGVKRHTGVEGEGRERDGCERGQV